MIGRSWPRRWQRLKLTHRQVGNRPTIGIKHSPWPHVRLSESDRIEAFSDNVRVLSITITLLVAEIVRPEPAQLLERLAAQWASYIAFLASFCYAGMNLSIRPCLVEDDVDPDLFKERFRATLGGVLHAIAGVVGWLSTPKRHCSLSGIFLVLPIFPASTVRV